MPGILIKIDNDGNILSWGWGADAEGDEFNGKLPRDFFKMATEKYKVVGNELIDKTAPAPDPVPVKEKKKKSEPKKSTPKKAMPKKVSPKKAVKKKSAPKKRKTRK